MPLDLFDRESYRAVRRPLLEAEPLPAACYTDQAFYDREARAIFQTHWNFVGREDMLAKPGDYIAFDFVGVPVLLLRGRDRVRAFHNLCRHRGTPLAQGSGSGLHALTCPYHSWVYDLTGRLLAAPGMQKAAGFRTADYGLKEIRLESFAGFIFINFDDQADSLADYLGADFVEEFGSYQFADMAMVRRKQYELACNWKSYVENAMEAYHVPTVHHASLVEQKCTVIAGKGHWIALHEEHDGTEAILKGDTTPFPQIPGLVGRADKGTYFALIYPSTMFGLTRDCMWWLELHPLAPGRTRLTVGSCFPKTTIARPDFGEIVQRYFKRWDKSIPEDNEISQLQHKGLESPLPQPGRLAPDEPVVHVFDNWVLDRVLGISG
ncbi:MAG: aromatic ring-hydroxylating dioxygenase subunit alpha [Alphaproteobacteria bacterium]|nr:aromatic ring-hydroxylating dioxygenase subunit alpha [Alphaproteobacteria bacterium]